MTLDKRVSECGLQVDHAQGYGDDCSLEQCAGWWFRPEFIINELNINSVITSPAHDENLTLSHMEYTVRGYAYTGTHLLAGSSGFLLCACALLPDLHACVFM